MVELITSNSNLSECRYSIFNCPVYAFASEAEALRVLMAHFIGTKKGEYSIAINAEKLIRQKTDGELRDLIANSAFPVVDGAGAVLALKLLHNKPSIKINLPRILLDSLQSCSGTLFIFGASEENNKKAIRTIEKEFPNIQIVGSSDGYQNSEKVLGRILQLDPDAALVGLGTPKQEYFIKKCISSGSNSFFVGCGGAIDILSGNVVRAPKFMVNNYLEWLYRLYKNPSRWRRQLVLPKFLIYLLWEYAFEKKQGKIRKN